MRKGIFAFAAGLVLFAAVQLHATVEGAKAAYMNGLAREKAKDYQGAIAEYQAALKEDPGYFYANKQMGNCYYYLGDKAQAVKNYDVYLANKKDDTALKAFADRLRPADVLTSPPPPPPRAVVVGDEAGTLSTNPAYFIKTGFAWLSNDGTDLTGGVSDPAFSVSSSVFDFDLAFGYQMANGFFANGGYEYLGRVSTIRSDVYVSSSSSATFVSENVFFVEPGFRFPLNRGIALMGGLKLGYASTSLSYGNASATYNSTAALAATGSGLIYEPEVGIQFLMGRRVGLNLNFGYRVDSIAAKPDIQIVNSGVKMGLGLNVYFKRLID